MTTMNDPSSADARGRSPSLASSPLLIAAAWLVVTVPAAWGIYRTIATAAKLFTAPPPAATTDSHPQTPLSLVPNTMPSLAATTQPMRP